MRAAARYWHTLRHLKPVQFYGRVWFRLHKPKPDASLAPAIRRLSGQWVKPAQREPSLIAPEAFVFLGEHGSLAEVGWDGPQREKLWRYNQHYFDDLNAMGSDTRTEWHTQLLTSWVHNNRPGRGNGWEPYPASLRIVNWVKWASAGHGLPAPCIQSLAVQVRWLRQRLEIHLLGNHLFANAKALVFAGLFFEGDEAERWLDEGLRILAREVPEQVLSDGGHFERSTMYHALALEDMLDLCNLLTRYEPALSGSQRECLARWRKRAGQMLQWIHSMCHPDGEIGFFNDTALGIAPSIQELDAYANRLGIAPPTTAAACWMKASGYARLQMPDAVALLDLAPVGPDYLPGHAHADTLSFELSVHGQRLLVNSGTSCYGSSAERLRQRGTAAHNTVTINEEDSSEVWSGFRVARRAYPFAASVTTDGDIHTARCSHDGYTRLPGRPVHERRWEMKAGGLCIEDRVKGQHQSAKARFHFHPDVQIETAQDAQTGYVRLPGGKAVTWRVSSGRATLMDATWHPRFGSSLANKCLEITLVEGAATLQLSWSDI